MSLNCGLGSIISHMVIDMDETRLQTISQLQVFLGGTVEVRFRVPDNDEARHQYASFLVNAGRTLFEVQSILGHSSPVVTQRYSHLSTKSLAEAANSASIAIQKGLKSGT